MKSTHFKNNFVNGKFQKPPADRGDQIARVNMSIEKPLFIYSWQTRFSAQELT